MHMQRAQCSDCAAAAGTACISVFHHRMAGEQWQSDLERQAFWHACSHSLLFIRFYSLIGHASALAAVMGCQQCQGTACFQCVDVYGLSQP